MSILTRKLKKNCGGMAYAKGGKVFPKQARNEERKYETGVHKSRIPMAEPGQSNAGYLLDIGKSDKAKEDHKTALRLLKSMKKPKLLAKGGMLTKMGYQSECTEHCVQPCEIHQESSGFAEETAPNRMPNKHGETEMGYQSDDAFLSKVLGRRKMSKGGRIANSDEIYAGFMPNEFDDLHLRDDLDFSYTGANSGDELGNDEEDKRRNQMISMVMKKRRKQHNPNPA